MLQRFSSEWFKLKKDDIRIGQVYVYLGPSSGPMHLEGWVKFPPGTREIQIIVNTDDYEAGIENKEMVIQ